jgi:hypothetical protein
MSTARIGQRKTAFPWALSSASIQHFLQADTGGTLASQWRDDKIQELSVVNVTVRKYMIFLKYQTDGDQAALIAGVVSSAFSWPTIEPAPWTAKAVFYCTLFVSLSAVATGSQQSIALTRYGRSADGLKDLKHLLTGNTTGKASRVQQYVWQLPVMLLNISIALFLIGLVILIWARAASSPDWDDDMKVCPVTR